MTSSTPPAEAAARNTGLVVEPLGVTEADDLPDGQEELGEVLEDWSDLPSDGGGVTRGEIDTVPHDGAVRRGK